MSASMLVRRQSLALGASRVSRAGSVVSRPRAFAPAPRFSLVAKAAASDEEDAADDDELVLGDIQVGESLDSEVLDDANAAPLDLGEAELSAIEAASAYAAIYSDELLAEADAGGDDLSPPEAVAARADEALDRILSNGADINIDAVAALAGDDAPEAEGVEDHQGPGGFRKYDEDVDAGMSQERREQVAQYKLTKTELANLVPEDWDNINIDWFSNKREENIPLPEYKLSFIWTERNIAVAVDQVYSRGQVSPLTEFFFWPRKDAWEELRLALEARPWISERDKVILLNRTTEVINFWQQEGEKPTLEAVKGAFPDCAFMGTSSPPAAPAAPAPAPAMSA
ncbi:hypothetical protein FOA52_000707 [Chlamydomonas sp. UWO 241]|nr:hypothetical protein FOA52_000707 [Chlamydomonas sp. UWO 241]